MSEWDKLQYVFFKPVVRNGLRDSTMWEILIGVLPIGSFKYHNATSKEWQSFHRATHCCCLFGPYFQAKNRSISCALPKVVTICYFVVVDGAT